MQKSFFYGLSLILLVVFITPACKKDSLQDPQLLEKSTLVQQETKVNGTEQDQTKVNDTAPRIDPEVKKPEPEPEPWLRRSEPEPEPWLVKLEPEPEPWQPVQKTLKP